jgi:hypothetical protein
MVLFRALGWLLLALAVAAVVHDGLVWWSDCALRLLPLGELWARLDFSSLHYAQTTIEGRAAGVFWNWMAAPLLRLPALPAFLMAGVIFLWIGRRIGSRAEPGFVGTRPPRRRRSRGGLS